jgi:hypothetical protein
LGIELRELVELLVGSPVVDFGGRSEPIASAKARYLAAHSPTERSAFQTADIAQRLLRGGWGANKVRRAGMRSDATGCGGRAKQSLLKKDQLHEPLSFVRSDFVLLTANLGIKAPPHVRFGLKPADRHILRLDFHPVVIGPQDRHLISSFCAATCSTAR